MSTHNMFSWRNKKNINTFGSKKSALTRAMLSIWNKIKKVHFLFLWKIMYLSKFLTNYVMSFLFPQIN